MLPALVLLDSCDELGELIVLCVDCYRSIRDVRLRSDQINALFEPLRGKAALLKKYDLMLSEEDVDMLDQAPFNWDVTRKATYNARERLTPLQALQAEKIKERAEDFGLKVNEFRKEFLAQAPFKYSVGDECYQQIDNWNQLIDSIEHDAKQIQELEQLFDVTINNWKEIRQCREELRWLKQASHRFVHSFELCQKEVTIHLCNRLCWNSLTYQPLSPICSTDSRPDFFSRRYGITWSSSSPSSLNGVRHCGTMSMWTLCSCKRTRHANAKYSPHPIQHTKHYSFDMVVVCIRQLQKEIRLLPKQSRAWDVYQGMATGLQDMSVALPLVQDLRDEAMRERHWKKLMRICGKSFVMDEKFSLQHLLALQLQVYVDAVGETVEQARMELKIDKQLARIDATWMSLHLSYEPFKSTGVHTLKMPDLVIEALDDHEVALQNMMGSRFMSFFEAQITSWKTRLAGVRSVLESWMEVQRQWCSLEAIFIGCKLLTKTHQQSRSCMKCDPEVFTLFAHNMWRTVAAEDIREQLPEDAKRFDSVDQIFKEQMSDASQTPNPLEACLRDGRDEEFHKCLSMVELCNRSLAEYLESKRKKFPRFYFISSLDLVDVLSQGRRVEQG